MKTEAATDIDRKYLVLQICVIFVVFSSVSFQTGCVTTRNLFAVRQSDPMAGAPRLRTMKNPPLEEVVAHLNQNTDKIESWRADNVTIRTNGWTLSGKLAVEKARRVRLFVSSPLGNEVDLGSNDEQFWVWSRRMEPAFVTCKHENMEIARQKMGIPFEPDWLMQALGVSPLPSTTVKLEAAPDHEHVRLVQQVITAHGLPLRRVVLVDLNKGKGVVIEHSLYDYNGVRIALAKLSGHKHDSKTGVVLPHRVQLELPQHQMSMTMELGKIQINPNSIPSQIWNMPEMPGYEVVHLDEGLDSKRIATRIKSGDDLDAIEDPLPKERRIREQGEFESDSTIESTGHARLSLEDDEVESSKPGEEEWEK